MHSAQVMHSICWPSRMSMPMGQTFTQAMQSMQSPLVPPSDFVASPLWILPRGSPRHSR